MKQTRSLFTLLPVIILTIVCVVFANLVHEASRDDIEANIKKAALAGITRVIKADYDNDIFTDVRQVPVPAIINSSGSVSVYHARNNGELQALAILPVETRGYSGQIKLIVGMDINANVTGLHVLSHNETTGFGARLHQDKSDWLTVFEQVSLANYKASDWAIKKEGGRFDQISGATITSRAVINIVRTLLEYYALHPDEFNRVQEP